MRVVHICNTDLGGGAGIAAYRLHKQLVRAGIESLMFVDDKRSDDFAVIESSSGNRTKWRKIGLRIERFLQRELMRKTGALWSRSQWPSFNVSKINKLNADIIHMHWMNLGMLSIRDISNLKAKKIVWSLHDMWPFSGGCHYLGNINEDCEDPKIELERKLDRRRKTKYWDALHIEWIPLSNWMKKSFFDSNFPIGHCGEVIWNSIPTDVFRPVDKTKARESLGISDATQVFLFGAINPHRDLRKGGDLLEKIILQLPEANSLNERGVWFVSFGGKEFHYRTQNGYTYHGVGKLQGDSALAAAYAAADVFMCTSREDNLPNTCVEAVASGVPVVAFDVGGLSDIVLPGRSGFLVEPFNLLEYSKILMGFIDGSHDPNLTASCRELALERFSPEVQLSRIREVYDSILTEEHVL